MSQGCVPARGAPTIFGWGQQCGVGACCKRGSDSDWDLPSAAILELGIGYPATNFVRAGCLLHTMGIPCHGPARPWYLMVSVHFRQPCQSWQWQSINVKSLQRQRRSLFAVRYVLRKSNLWTELSNLPCLPHVLSKLMFH